MRKKLKWFLIVSGLFLAPPAYITIDLLLHWNENYVEDGFSHDLMAYVFYGARDPKRRDIYPIRIDVFDVGEDVFTLNSFSRKGYENHSIAALRSITTHPEIKETIDILREFGEKEKQYTPFYLREKSSQTTARYDVFFQYPKGVWRCSIFQTGNRFYMDNGVSALYWIPNKVVAALGIPVPTNEIADKKKN